MSTIYSTAESLPLVIPCHHARLSVDDYHKMIADGTLTENRRLELLKGVLVEKITNNPAHANSVIALMTLLLRVVPVGYSVRSQSPITLRDSEPEPDISIVRGELQDFWQRHPSPAEVLLVIEVSSSSLLTDRFKAEIYAEAGIPFYLIVNLTARRVEVYSQPTQTAGGLRYGEPRLFLAEDSIPVILDGNEIGQIAAAQLLPTIAAP